MTDQDKPNTDIDDVEGHRLQWNAADAESAEGDDDTEGHGYKWANSESAEGDDDVEGHGKKGGADSESAEGDDDVAGHIYVEERDDLNGQRLR